MSQQLDEESIIEKVSGLSARGKRKALRKLIAELEELDRLVDSSQEKLISICRERGLDFYALKDEDKEDLIDRIIHGE